MKIYQYCERNTVKHQVIFCAIYKVLMNKSICDLKTKMNQKMNREIRRMNIQIHTSSMLCSSMHLFFIYALSNIVTASPAAPNNNSFPGNKYKKFVFI